MTTAPASMPPRSQRHALLYVFIAMAALVAVGVIVFVTADHVETSDSLLGVQGSGVPATEVRDLPTFKGVDLAGSNSVSVIVGNAQSVRMFGDNNLLGHVITEVRSGELVIGDRGSFRTRSPMQVVVTVPALDQVTMSGSG